MIRHKTDLSLFYVGSAVDFHKRVVRHKRDCFNEKSGCYSYKIYITIRERGWDNFDKFIIDVCVTDDRDVLFEMEKQYILDLKPTLNTNNYTYNNNQNARENYMKNREHRIKLVAEWKRQNRDRVREYSRRRNFILREWRIVTTELRRIEI